ncbi:unnamed protein product [Symbiodinium sp. KB8]|nr:unnamed protein product [Symbiodinium sp. KB8]
MKRGRCRSGRWGAALCTAGVCWIAPGISFTASTQLRVPFKAPGRLTLRRAGLQPPQLDSQSEPPVETGRNPQAVATDFAWGIVLLPASVLGLIIAYLFSGFLSATSQPPPEVPLSESLAALISIEDDYAVRGPGMGLRQRLSRWFHWAEPNRRVDFEIKDLPNSPLKDDKIRQRGKDAAEDIAMTVEYFVAGNGIIDDSGSSRMADRIAEDEAARGYPEAEKFAEKALHEGRKALSETVSLLQEALDSQEEAEEAEVAE